MKNRGLAALCFLVVVGILTAGLWPFTPFPKNEVSWPANEQGLLFGDYGTVLSSGPFTPTQTDRGCAIEMWLVPGLTDDANTILAFSTTENPQGFRAGQNRTTLYLARTFRPSSSSQEQTKWMAIHNVFLQGKQVFLSVTTDTGGTAVYIDGNQAQLDRRFGLSCAEFKGTMVVANSPVANNSWSGLMKGIAVYYSGLSAQQVSEHYHLWLAGAGSSLATQNADALYLFGDSGNRITNKGSGKQPDLIIPRSYTVLHPPFLLPFWKGFSFDRSYWVDIANNILAFVPLGFFVSAFLSGTQLRSHSFWSTVILGGALSLTIEVLQYFIPMRDSGTMDLITNTTGTTLGAWLFVLQTQYDWLGKLPIVRRIWEVLCPANSCIRRSVGSKMTASGQEREPQRV